MGVWFLAALAVLPGLNAPVILPDEFGYWAQAAAMTGRDWSGTVSQFSWYSFGYGLLMFPFMAVIQDPTTIHQIRRISRKERKDPQTGWAGCLLCRLPALE